MERAVKIVRTPDNHFNNLKDYPFEANYQDISGLRMHYLDEGDRKSNDIILMLHGEPSWSYLYRHMIPICAQAGYRVIAPDLIGFGRSDKPTKKSNYSYLKHVTWVTEFIEELGLKNITLVCQDWGSLIGLRVAAEQSERFSRIVVGNGFLPTGKQELPKIFKIWRAFAKYSPWFPIDKIIDKGSFKILDKEELKAYRAPFPSSKYKAGARIFPQLVPSSLQDPAANANREAWELLGQWKKPFLTCFSNGDPITRGLDKLLQAHIPGAKGQAHQVIKGGHFLQEDSPEEFAEIINQFIADN